MAPRDLVHRYLKVGTISIDAVRPRLWSQSVDATHYSGSGEKYQMAILEQYRIYTEMADRTSARRGLTNTFFLTLNTLVFAMIGTFWQHRPTGAAWYLVFPLCALLVQCAAWFWLVRSYRQLNAAKYVVIGVLEERLPASPYWQAEWKALGEGKDTALYWPFTHLEQWIPASFALIYSSAFTVALVA
ncbi:RipA family octameric membrane protein [Cryptosporangium arvum]|uniref:Small integral membrane protein n=1 Tax=Cryptosporangium arvum DSM 44712 TaxID=927661 RepID=A0A010ZRM7_9ACTN|nr:hypothetical protein [Cryptosporangium arvum]EXG79872.1 hypothetical protein CryarDRAFT_0922 [Cryptosporangium arvum DSM 44712]